MVHVRVKLNPVLLEPSLTLIALHWVKRHIVIIRNLMFYHATMPLVVDVVCKRIIFYQSDAIESVSIQKDALSSMFWGCAVSVVH